MDKWIDIGKIVCLSLMLDFLKYDIIGLTTGVILIYKSMAKYALNDSLSKGIRGGISKGLTAVGQGIYKALPNQKNTLNKVADFANKPVNIAKSIGLKNKKRKGMKKKMTKKHKSKPGDLFNAFKAKKMKKHG